MINWILPDGSRRRNFLRTVLHRLSNSQKWRLYHTEYNSVRQDYYSNHVKLRIDEKDSDPLISLVVPCFNTPYRYLYELMDSVFAQGYEKWELILVDGSTTESANEVVYEASKRDIRIKYIKVQNRGIAENTNVGMREAKGTYIAFLDHDDTLDPDALAECVVAIREFNPDLLYSDEDNISDDSSRFANPHFKPDFSQAMIMCANYITHFVMVKTQLAKQIGYIEKGFDGAQDYNFILQIIEKTDSIYHIPKILYHWREAVNSTAANFDNKKHVTDAGVKALNNYCERNAIPAQARALAGLPGFYEIVFNLLPKRRAIVMNVSGISRVEKQFLLESFKAHEEVKKYDIDCFIDYDESLICNDYDEAVFIHRPLRPIRRKDKSISAMFGFLSLGYKATTPRLISKGKIINCGYVWDGDSMVALYRGTDPARPQYFGYPGWNRDVSAIDDSLICASTKFYSEFLGKKLITADRVAVLGQYDFLQFTTRSKPLTASKGHYYNPNLSYEVYPKIIDKQLVIHEPKVSK